MNLLGNYSSYLLIAEIVLVLAVIATLVYFKFKKTKRTLEALQEKAKLGNLFDELGRVVDAEISELNHNMRQEKLKKRAQFLQAEKNALTQSRGDLRLFWENMQPIYQQFFDDSAMVDEKSALLEKLSLLEQELEQVKNAQQQDDASQEQVDNDRDELQSSLELLDKQVKLQEKKSNNLEKFRDLYFELQDNLDEALALNEKLSQELQQSSHNIGKIDELKQQLLANEQKRKELEKRNAILERELIAINGQINSVSPQKNAVTKVYFEHDVSDDDQSASSVLSLQKLQIKELKNIVDDLVTEVSDKSKIIDNLKKIESKANEMESVVFILEDENEFLRNQLSELLKMDITSQSHVDEMKRELENLRAKYSSLDEKYVKLETRYLKLVG